MESGEDINGGFLFSDATNSRNSFVQLSFIGSRGGYQFKKFRHALLRRERAVVFMLPSFSLGEAAEFFHKWRDVLHRCSPYLRSKELPAWSSRFPRTIFDAE